MIRQDWSSLKKLLFFQMAAGGGAAVEDTATGNPLTFLTDLARPLKSLLIPFTPQQEGSGDPSPSNIRSILPWNGLTVGQINGTAPTISNNSGMANADGEWKNTVTDSKTRFDAYIQLYKDSSYIKGVGNKSISASGIYSITFNVDDANCNRIVFLHSGSQNNLSVRFPFNLPQGTYTISFNVVSANPSVVGGLAIKDIFLVAGADVQRTETDIVFQSPVYGGTLDVVSGVLTVEWAKISFKWGDCRFQENLGSNTRKTYDIGSRMFVNGSVNSMCNVTNVYYNNNSSDTVHYYINSRGDVVYMVLPNDLSEETEIEICAKLLTPQTVQLTPEQITAIKGINTMWSDADGSMTATYLKKG